MYLFNASILFLMISLASSKEINYSFTVQRAISNPDGYPRSVIAVSPSATPIGSTGDQRLFPGPLIHGQKGDSVVVRIHNNFLTEVTSLHFHGLFMKNNAWMDGNGGITQPHIPPMSMFTYRFNLTQTGTYWYHSHTGHQYLDGMLGPIVIDYPDSEMDPVKKEFDYSADYTIMLQEWFHEKADDLFLNYQAPYNSFKYSNGQRFTPSFYPLRAPSVLINGRAQFNCQINHTCVNFIDSCGGPSYCLFARDSFFGSCDPNTHVPDKFLCTGNSIRLRLIHSGIMTPIQFWIDQHPLIVVARDGVETVHVTFDTVQLAAAQRLDLIVKCSKIQTGKSYSIFARLNDPSIQPVVWSSALLIYPDSSQLASPILMPDTAPFSNFSHTEFEYQLKPLRTRTAPPAQRRVVIQFNELTSPKTDGYKLEESIVNNITFKMPMTPLLQEAYLGRLPGHSAVVEEPGPVRNLRSTNILQLEYGETVEIVHVSMEQDHHSWHIHGYNMEFIEKGILDLNKDFDFDGVTACGDPNTVSIKQDVLARIGPGLSKEAPVLTIGDTYYTNGVSYAIFRLTLDNAGPWFFHCHINWHMENGMAILLSVERNGKYPDLVKPPADFPAYLPLPTFVMKSGDL